MAAWRGVMAAAAAWHGVSSIWRKQSIAAWRISAAISSNVVAAKSSARQHRQHGVMAAGAQSGAACYLRITMPSRLCAGAALTGYQHGVCGNNSIARNIKSAAA